MVQFSVKHEQGIDCGSGYVKLFPATLNQEDMHSESEYYIMFSKPSDSSHQPCEVLMRTTADGKKAHADLEREIPNAIAPSSYVVGHFKDLKKSSPKPKR